MAVKDTYSFEPVGAVDPTAPVAEAVPESNGDSERPSDTAIIVGCGLVGWVVA